MFNNKITIIGAGAVGATLAYTLSFQKEISQIALIDIDQRQLEGEVLDINTCSPDICNCKITKGSYADCADSSVIVISAGLNRAIGQKREDLIETNKEIMKSIVDNIKQYYQDAFLLIVSNPVDQLTAYVQKYGEFRKEKICSTGCALDLSRLIALLSDYLKVDKRDISIQILGTHGDGMIEWNQARVQGIPLFEFCNRNGICMDIEEMNNLTARVKNMGMDIIERKGRTVYAISSVATNIIKSLLQEECTPMIVGTCLGEAENIVTSKLVFVGNTAIRERGE